MVSIVIKLDLLFLDKESSTTSCILEDLAFENIKKEIFKTDEEVMYEKFTSVLLKPLKSMNSIIERQNILKDFIRYPSLADNINSTCKKINEYATVTRKTLYQNIEPLYRLKENLSTTKQALELPEKMYNILKGKEYNSDGLNNLLKYFENYKEFKELSHDITSASNIIFSSCASLSINLMNNLKVSQAKINHTENCCMTRQREKSILKLFGSKTNSNVIDFSSASIKHVFNEINEKTIFNLCGIIAYINSELHEVFNHISSQLQFYLASLRIVEYLDENKLKYSFPIINKHKKIKAIELYDLNLEVFFRKQKLDDKIVANDVNSESGNIYIITGKNGGGKTTFIRSIGIAQLLAQAGMVVPSGNYACGVFSSIITHFPKEEDNNMNFGKLAEELTRLKNDIKKIKGGALILMNESFATTNEREGSAIAEDVLSAFSHSESLIYFVTHFCEFAKEIDTLNGKLSSEKKAINLVADNNKINFL